MERLVDLAQAAQDIRGFVRRGWDHLDGLEAPRQRPVALDVAPVLAPSGSANTADQAPREGRLEQAGRIQRPDRPPGAQQHVQLVNEDDDVPRLDDLGQQALEPLLEIAAILRSGDRAGQIELDNPHPVEGGGRFFGGDATGQPFDKGRFPDAGLSHQHRVVLGTAQQHLCQAP